MKKRIVLVLATLFLATSAHASGGAGAFGSWWDSKDYGALYGGGARLGFEIFSGIALEARASYLSNDLIDDNDPAMAVIPLEGALLVNLPLGDEILKCDAALKNPTTLKDPTKSALAKP